MLRARVHTLLPLLLLTVGCSDESTTGPEVGLDPANVVYPQTGEVCDNRCLAGDLAGGWNLTLTPMSAYNLEPYEVHDPTTRGSSVNGGWCGYRKSDGSFVACHMPVSWTKKYASAPDGAVSILGIDAGGTPRVVFKGFAPLPTIELLEYDRPESAACSTASLRKCTGGFRLKIDLRNSDWYNKDRIYIRGVTAGGSFYTLPDTGYVRSGTTFEWTWDEVWPGEPGSRIVVLYYPWDNNPTRMELSVPMYDASPELTLEAIPVQYTAPAGSAVQVTAGTDVLFEPSTPHATTMQVTGWEWTPSDPMAPPQSIPCGPGDAECSVEVVQDGTMKVSATVDGQTREATASVDVTQAPTFLTCTPALRGLEAICTVVANGHTIDVTRWRFTASPDIDVVRLSSSQEWGGIVVADGTVTVELRIDGELTSLTEPLWVTDRNWAWSDADWTYRQGQAPELGAPQPNTGSFTLGWNCSFPDCADGWVLPDISRGTPGGYATDQVADDGPNHGVWYITGSTFYIDRASNLNKHIFDRSDAASFILTGQLATDCSSILNPLDANWHELNAICKGLPVQDMITAAWAHEGYGINGKGGPAAGHQAYGEAAAAVNDLHAAVEGLSAMTEATLDAQVEDYFRVASSTIDAESQRVHQVHGNYPATYWWTYDLNQDTYVWHEWNPF